MADWVKVAGDGDIADGGCKQVELAGEAVAVFNVAGRLHAIQNSCIHRGGPLSEGDLDGDLVTCPWHFWQYDVVTGKTSDFPDTGLEVFQVRVEGDDVLVEV